MSLSLEKEPLGRGWRCIAPRRIKLTRGSAHPGIPKWAPSMVRVQASGTTINADFATSFLTAAFPALTLTLLGRLRPKARIAIERQGESKATSHGEVKRSPQKKLRTGVNAEATFWNALRPSSKPLRLRTGPTAAGLDAIAAAIWSAGAERLMSSWTSPRGEISAILQIFGVASYAKASRGHAGRLSRECANSESLDRQR
jgi:hypothetical protein